MRSSLPDGFALREAREDDARAIAALIQAYDIAHGADERTTETDVRTWWRDFDEDGRAWLVLDADATPAAYFEVFRLRESVTLDGYVHPEFAGLGLGTAIVALGEQRARELGADGLRCGTLGADQAATALLRANGWEQERVFLRMVIDLATPEDPPAPPDGLILRTLRREEAAAFHAAKEDAFVDHWNFRPEPFDIFRRRAIDTDDFDPTLWWVVEDHGELAAVLRCTRKRFEMGWVDTLAVRRAWRRRGLGELLLRTAFAEFARRGETHVGLGVDAENITGATRLYERVGMRTRFFATIFRKVLE
jgi:ribosomal protein S18 acetylase RimI-like enzyme